MVIRALDNVSKYTWVEMPEGPEVHIISRRLKQVIEGLSIVSVEAMERARYHRLDLLPIPAKVINVSAQGKRVLFVTDCGVVAFFLGMSGRLIFNKSKHSNIKFEFGVPMDEDTSLLITDATLYFDDYRSFGLVSFLETEDDVVNYFRNIGPDLILQPPSPDEYLSIFRSAPQSMQLCCFLLDQSYLSGIGNYIKSEIMYYSGIIPYRTLSSISDEDVVLLREVTLKIINHSLATGGLTSKDNWHPDGKRGEFETSVYGRVRDPLGRRISKEVFKDGRTTYWVPEVQV